MTFSTSWMSTGKISSRLVRRVARLPARVQTKLLVGFLTIAGLLVLLGAVGIEVLNGINGRTDELIRLQRKIAAYRQVQHDTIYQLYSISTALLLQDEQMLDAALRQLNQFGYDIDRMEFVAQNEAEILAKVLKDYGEFTKTLTGVVELIRDGQTAEARETQRTEIVPLADQLERQTNQLVNIAEADMVAAIDATARTYHASRVIVIVFAVGSLLLALGLGYVISLSLISPVREIEKGLRRLAAGAFGQRVDVANRDELGELADSVNQTSEQLGRLYLEIEARNRDLSEALEQQTATSAILRAIAASPTDIQPMLNTVAESAAKLCDAFDVAIGLSDSARDFLVMKAHYGVIPVSMVTLPIGRDWPAGVAFLDRRPVHVRDIMEAAEEFPFGHAMALENGFRTSLAVPLLREGEAIGIIGVRRKKVRPFSDKQIALLTTFADQVVIAIESVRLFEEVQTRTAELARTVSELEALGEVSRAVNSTLDLNTVLETIAAKAVQLSRSDAGAIYVYSKSTEKFRLRATYGMSAELTTAITNQTVGLNDAGIGEAARNRAPLQMPDLRQGVSSPVHQIVLDAGYLSLLVVPLLRPNKIVGALVVRRKTTGRFPDSTVQLMQTFAAQSVLAIQNARLFSEIEEKSYQLEIASRHKSQFLANMSHELRTPLNAVMGFSEMLADGLYGQLPEKAVTTLARIQANGKHLLGLINDVLDLSKIEAGQLQLAIESYSPAQIVKSAGAAAEPLARAKNLALNMVIAEDMPLGMGDERRLTQVLLNLVGNAVKFTDQGSVEITARAINGSFEFTVRDTGPGIAPEYQSRIFEEFQQVDDSSTRKKGGTGLGLAISKRIVEMHGGTIGVESTVGVGSEFKVTIPVQAEQKSEAA